MNFINSYKSTNKKEKYSIEIRIGTMTLFEITFCPCDTCASKKKSCPKFRLMLLNLGFEI